VTKSGRTRPARIWPSGEFTESSWNWMLPLISAVRASLLPRKGTWIASSPLFFRIIAMPTWARLPTPGLP
jgi:hypothetical protein